MPIPLPDRPGTEASTQLEAPISVRLAHSDNIVSREVAGETIVVPICRGVGDLDSVYTFNSVGKHLWRLLEHGQTAEEMAKWVAVHYEVNAAQALLDVQTYLSELREIGLIRTA
jgi:hypothetical protein